MLSDNVACGTGALGIYFFSWHGAIMRPSRVAARKVRGLGWRKP
jgi:hypothetical protein